MITWIEPAAGARRKRKMIPRPVWREWVGWYVRCAIFFVFFNILGPLIYRRPMDDPASLLSQAGMLVVAIVPLPWITRWFAKGTVSITRTGVGYEFSDYKGSENLVPWSEVGSYKVIKEDGHRVLLLKGADGEEIQRYHLARKVDLRELDQKMGWYARKLELNHPDRDTTDGSLS